MKLFFNFSKLFVPYILWLFLREELKRNRRFLLRDLERNFFWNTMTNGLYKGMTNGLYKGMTNGLWKTITNGLWKTITNGLYKGMTNGLY